MIIEKAYAKVNLALEVGQENKDGYHDVNNIMVPVDLFDILTFEEINSDVILLDNTNIKSTDNIIYKAAKLFLQTYKINKGVLITLEKNIPQEAGLAGGSADAAATFRGLTKLFNLDIPLDELAQLSISLGSDIAYCIYDKAALCTGRGTKVKLINANYPKWNILLVKPPFGCSTKEIYKKYKKDEENKKKKLNNVIKALETGDLALLQENSFNELEAPAFKLYPELEKLRLDYSSKTYCMMSGSGSTLFMISDDLELLTKIKENSSKYINLYLTKLL